MTWQVYYAKTSGGDIALPVGSALDVSYTTDNMNSSQDWPCAVYIEFYADVGLTTPVSPTSGSINVYGAPIGTNYLTSSNVATIPASSVSYPKSTYVPPTFKGALLYGQVQLVNIVGAAFAKVVFYRTTEI